MNISTSEARDLIEQTFADFTSFLRRKKVAFSSPSMPYAFRALIMDLPEWTSAKNPSDMDYLFKDLSADGYNYLLQQCLELATIYELPTRGKLAGATVEKSIAPLPSKNATPLFQAALSGNWAAGKVRHHWINNGDGTFTAKLGATLWVLYGNNWQEESGYTGDPTLLQPGTVVGRNNTLIEKFDSRLGSEIENTSELQPVPHEQQTSSECLPPPVPRTPADYQMRYLKYLHGRAEKTENGCEKGRIAARLRERLPHFDIGGLFSIDKKFMNGELRDFLNVNENGIDHYIFEEVKDDSDWSEASSGNSRFHQSTANSTEIVSNPNTKYDHRHMDRLERWIYIRLNAKFTHTDGREAVFRPRGAYIDDGPDKGTFNYALSETNPLEHALYDLAPFSLNPPRGYNSNCWKIFNYGLYGNSYYWDWKYWT